MSDNNMECKCEQKELCSKLRNEGLKRMIYKFETRYLSNMSINEVNHRLSGIKNALEIYGCMPCQALIKRAEWLIKANGESHRFILSHSKQSNVEAFIAELKAFVKEA